MVFDESIDAASHCGRAALGMMDRHGIPAYPDNFAVWYAFVSGRIPALSAAIDAQLRSGAPFTAEINADLFARFITFPGNENDLAALARRLGDAIERVEDCLRDVDKGASHYGVTLEQFSGKLPCEPGDVGLPGLIRTVIDETKAMIDINRRLDRRLSQSSGEVARLREDMDALRREATRDHLTGLANRKMFDSGLIAATRAADQDGRPLSLMMVDIDHFKRFNDTHGHVLGDQVLKLVARSLAEGIDGEALAARYGGEEFAVVLPGVAFSTAHALADRVRAAVANRVITNRRTGQALGQVTLSVGIAQYMPGEERPATLVQRADEALYLAKREGRNRVRGDHPGGDES